MELDLRDLAADWRKEAACIGMERLFFPDPSELKIAEQAKAICRTCPVIDDCSEYVLNNRASMTQIGIWAGLSPLERAAKRRSKRGMKVCTGCGISKPFIAFPQGAHRKDGLLPRCRACKNTYDRNYTRAYVPKQRRKECVVCGKEYRAERRKTCSDMCKSVLLSRRPHVDTVQRDCAECGTSFLSVNRTLTCSESCRMVRIRRQQVEYKQKVRA